MLHKAPGPDGSVHVTFQLPHPSDDDRAWLGGGFNDWSTDAHPMEKVDGTFAATIPLQPGQSYRFRYLLEGDRWENDWEADAYLPNSYGGDDSVVDLTDAVVDLTEPAPKPKPAPKK